MYPARTIERNLAVLLAGRAAAAGTTLAATLLLTRGLSTEDFGHYGLFVSLFTLAGAFVDFGGNAVATREIARGRPPALVLGGHLAARAALAVAALAGIEAYLAAALPPGPLLVLAPAGLGILLLVGNGMEAWFHATGRVGIPVVPRALFQGVFVAGLALPGHLTLGGAVALRVGCAGAAALAVAALGIARIRPELGGGVGGGVGEAARRALGFLRRSAPVGVAGFLTMLYFYLDTMMLQVLRGPRDVAVYQAAYRVFGFETTVLGCVLTVLFPLLAAGYARDRETFRRLAGRSLLTVALFALPAAACGWILAPEVVLGFYGGGDYAGSETPLRLLMAASIAVGGGMVGSSALIASGRQRPWALLAASGVAVNAVANLLVLPRYGAAGAAATTLATEAWIAAATLALVARRDPPRLPAGAAARAGGVAVAFAAGAWLLRGRSVWLAAALLGPAFLLVAWGAARSLRQGGGGR